QEGAAPDAGGHGLRPARPWSRRTGPRAGTWWNVVVSERAAVSSARTMAYAGSSCEGEYSSCGDVVITAGAVVGPVSPVPQPSARVPCGCGWRCVAEETFGTSCSPRTGGIFMDVPVWVWLATVGVILAMLAVDYVVHVRTPHAPSLREA